MTHWQNRPEPGWEAFRFNQPYASGLSRLREMMAKTDFDPATLWQWGTMQAIALLEVLKGCEAAFGAAGQEVVFAALRRVGRDVGRQILAGVELPDEMTGAEFASFFASVCNRIAYASLEAPHIDGDAAASFDILWCPHQDHYEAFDCRVQRYFVQGMLDAAREHNPDFDFELRFDSTIPAGASICRFTLWRASSREKRAWEEYTRRLEEKALARAGRAGQA